uniref:Glutamate receptor-interacting protein 1 n=1 Tax=Cryptocotyle lingua TaxID=66766 RepID=A0A7U0TIC8_9TREM|nr:glutamate receptor-interacting protein 1 [Cryptocotyle lingua]
MKPHHHHHHSTSQQQQQPQRQQQSKRGIPETRAEEPEQSYRKHVVHKSKPVGSGSTKPTPKSISSSEQKTNLIDFSKVRSSKPSAGSSGKSEIFRDLIGRSKTGESSLPKGSWVASSSHPTGTIYHQSPSESTTNTTSDSQEPERHLPSTESSQGLPLFGRLTVELLKGDESNLGITVADGAESREPPTIANIRPGSVADRSDCLLVGDRLLSIESFHRRHAEVTARTTKAAGPWVRIEIEYELPDLPPVGCTVKHMLVDLDTRGEGAGLVIRGGWNRAASHIRPLTVMRIRENSMADFDGRIKPGDRILAINNIQTGRLSCDEAIKQIEASKSRLNLVVEYNVANFELDRNVSGAVMVEIEKPGNEDLGISLAPCHEVKTGQNAFFINYLRQGSIADRCGALFTGDRVEAIDDIHVEDLTLQEAMRRLKHNGLDRVRLQIVPNAISDPERQSTKPLTVRSTELPRTSQPTWSSPTSTTQRSRSRSKSHRSHGEAADTGPCVCNQDGGYMLMEFSPDISDASVPSLMTSKAELCRSEEVEVCLEPDDTLGYGFTLCAAGQGSTQDSQLIRFPVVDRVDIGGSAYKSGVIQEGDRVITINGHSTLNRTVEELNNEFLTPEAAQRRMSLRLTLVTQYSVADTVVPSAGVFDVKLVRRAANLGINLQASIKKQEGQPLLISKVIPGSVASRSGSINPGDILLAVNGVSLSSCSLAEAIRLLQSPTEEIVTLRVQKIGVSPPSPCSENLLVRSSPDTSNLFTRAIRYRRSDSVPEAELTKTLPIQCHELNVKQKYNTDGHLHGKELDASSAPQRPKSGGFKAPFLYQVEQVGTDRSTSSGQDDVHTPTVKSMTKSRTTSSSNEPSIKKHSDGPTKLKTPQANVDEIRRRLISSPEDLSQDEGITIVRVVLKRKSAECPWGITICGTDDASNAPVFIDSLNPGDPGATSGLLFPGDRILAINGSALNAGHTLTQAMRMLQRYPDRVILHLARPNQLPSESNRPDGSNDEDNGRDVPLDKHEPTGESKSDVNRRLSLKKVVAMSNFSRSFDSMTNSVGSGTAFTTASDMLPNSVTTPGNPLGSEGTRPKSATSVRTLQSGEVGKTTNATRMRTYSGVDPGATVQKQLGEPNGRSKSHEYFKKSDIQTKPSVSRLSPKAMTKPGDQSAGGIQSEPQSFGDWMFTEPGDGLSFGSETNEEDGAAYVLDHPEFYPAYTDYNEVDLINIQCPGCREAIINELRQQRLQASHRGRRHGEQMSHRHLRRRPQSQQRSAPSSTFDRTSAQVQKSTGPQNKFSDTEPPKATFFCPEQELNTKPGPSYWYASDLAPITRHSKSDSRINLAGNLDVELEQPSTTIPTPKPTRMRLKPTVTNDRPTEKPVAPQHRYTGAKPKLVGRHHIPTKHYDRRYRLEDFGTGGTAFSLDDPAIDSPVVQNATSLEERSNLAQQIGRPTGDPLDIGSTSAGKLRTQERGVWCTWIRLTKASPSDSYGIGVSEGISTRGIFVSAIRPNSSADRSGQLHLYDRILMVNDRLVEGLTCSEVVGLISRSDKFLDLLVQRRISRTKRSQPHGTQRQKVNAPRSHKLPGPNAGTSISPNRVAQTNLTVI